MNFVLAAGVIILAYLIGSINFAVIFTKAFAHKDIRDEGSGNAGMTNVMRAVGVMPGLLTFLCDALKGAAACYLGKVVFDSLHTAVESRHFLGVYGAFACGVACMIGHIFPVFFQFKGGKGVAISVGIFAICNPLAIIAGLAVFAVLLPTVKIMSISSLTATVVVVVMSIVFPNPVAALLPQAICAVVMGVIIFVKHKDNIVRLMKGEENKFTIKKGK